MQSRRQPEQAPGQCKMNGNQQNPGKCRRQAQGQRMIAQQRDKCRLKVVEPGLVTVGFLEVDCQVARARMARSISQLATSSCSRPGGERWLIP